MSIVPKHPYTSVFEGGINLHLNSKFQVFFINHTDKKTTWVDPRTGRPSALPVQSNVPNRRHEDDLGKLSFKQGHRQEFQTMGA